MVVTIDDGAWRGPYSVTNVQSFAGRNEADGGDIFLNEVQFLLWRKLSPWG